MMKTRFCSVFLTLLLLGTSASWASEGQNHWGYKGETGPEHWAKLSHAFANCALGKNQSPIDITDTIEAEMPPLAFFYKTAARDIVNTGHSIQLDFPKNAGIVVDNQTFELKQVHFHSPSENTIDGRHFPMEAHFVHADERGNLAVVALLFEIGGTNPVLGKLWRFIPTHRGEAFGIADKLPPSRLLPKDKDYYRFNGSLTTPPCTEGVYWFVLKQPVTASREQIERFSRVMRHPNNRPIQPTNARPLLR